MTEDQRKNESDQLPEEGPEEQVVDDGGSSESGSRESAEDQARSEADVQEGEEQATGNRRSAG